MEVVVEAKGQPSIAEGIDQGGQGYVPSELNFCLAANQSIAAKADVPVLRGSSFRLR